MALNASAWTLSGTVYGGSNPLPDVAVTLIDANTLTQLDTTITDSGGLYSFAVNDGTYNLTITPPNGSGFSESVEPISKSI